MEGENERIIEMYNKGYSYQTIGDAVGLAKKTINRRVDKLKEEGILSDRPLPTGNVRANNRTPNHDRHRALLNDVKRMYEAGVEIEDICKDLSLAVVTVKKAVSELTRVGMIKRPTPSKKFRKNRKQKPWRIGEPHKCDPNTCIYGNENKDNNDYAKNGCNFCLITGKCRSTICKREACTVYEEVTPTNKRRRVDTKPCI